MKKLLLTLVLATVTLLSTAQTHSWQRLADLHYDIAARYETSMVSYNNKLYFIGGYETGGNGTISTTLCDFWEYDPVTKQYKDMGFPFDVFGTNGYKPNMSVVGNSFWLLRGGAFYEYNYSTKIWTYKGNQSAIPSGMSADLLGSSFVIGTAIYFVNGNGKLFSYETTLNQWSQHATLPDQSGRGSGFGFTINGKGYYGGGTQGTTAANFYEYDPSNDVWTQKASCTYHASANHAAIVNGKAYVHGFSSTATQDYPGGPWVYTYRDAISEYDPTTNTWVVTHKNDGPKISRSALAAVNNKLYSFSGGYIGSIYGSTTSNEMWNYDTSSKTWSRDYDYSGGNRFSAFGYHYNNKIYVGGGADIYARNDTWEYDIALDKWERKANSPNFLYHQAQAVINSKIYLIGGYDNSYSSNSVRSYDAATNTWTTRANLPLAVRKPGAFVINNKIYAGAGTLSGGSTSNAFYEYDVAANTWTAKRTCPKAGDVASGFSYNDIGYFLFTDNTLYAYDPATNLWSQKATSAISSTDWINKFDAIVKDNYIYFLTKYSNTNSSVARYDPVNDVWVNNLFDAPFAKQGATAVLAGNDVYVGMGYDIFQPITGGTYYHIENDWHKLSFEANVSTMVAQTISSKCNTNSIVQNRTFTDEEGKLFFAALNQTPGYSQCFNLRSLSGSYREQLIRMDGTAPTYAAMFMNKNFTPSGGGFGPSSTLRMYFTDAEINAFISAFNAKYGTAKTINDLQIVYSVAGTIDLDPLNNPLYQYGASSAANYYSRTTTVSNYKTSDKYLQTIFTTGTSGEFYVILATPATTLPVSIIDFNASLKTNGALLTWTTASELNNKHFIIEKSTDGTTFTPIATIDGKGTSREKSSYQFTDVNFFQSAYYRLTQVDLNGTKTVYDELIRHVKSLADGDKVTVYPNPTTDKINIKLPSSVANTEVKLIDVNGKTLDSKSASGGQTLTFALQHLPKGLYLLQYTDGGQLQTQKVVKQ